MYAEYVKNFDQAMSTLSKWKQKSPKFAGVIENIQVLSRNHDGQNQQHFFFFVKMKRKNGENLVV